MARAAAFFDLDRTLMAGSSGVHWARAAYRSDLVGFGQLLRWLGNGLRFRLRGSTDASTQALLEQVTATMRGVRQRDLARLAPEVLAGILPRIHREMLDEVWRHQDEGRATFIVSAADDGTVSLLAHVLGMDGAIGTRYAVDPAGRYTGRLEGPFIYRQGKVRAVRDFATAHDIDLDASWAYSDSESDVPMLEEVGHAVVVNPDPELTSIAKRRRWQIMRFDRLGRYLAVGATTLVAGVVGGSGTWLALRYRRAGGAIGALNPSRWR